MAKTSKAVSFKNATIDLDNMIILEVGKDFCKEYSLQKVLEDWNGIEGISLSLKIDDELPSIDESDDSSTKGD